MGKLKASTVFRAFSIWIILLAWAIQPSLEIFQNLHILLLKPTPVQAVAIQQNSHSGKICQHHPEGCPKDCFCPNQIVQEQDAGNLHLVKERLFEPSLVQCTEKAPRQVLQSNSIGLVDLPLEYIPPMRQIGKNIISSTSMPAAPPLDPALKIPIALPA